MARSCASLLLALILALVIQRPALAAVKSAYFTEGASIPAKPGATLENWEREAKHNVTMWMNKLMLRTMLATRQLHEARVRGTKVDPINFSLRKAHSLSEGLLAEHPKYQALFQLSSPFISCPPPGDLAKVGGRIIKNRKGETGEDGYKYLCNVDQLKDGCTVLSIGSLGDTSFEQSILDTTPCTIITLDCTLTKPLQTLGPRHQFYPLCLGSEEQSQANPAFVTLPQLMRKIGKQRVDVLKMDIEGFEWDVLSSMGTEEGYEDSLPTQMAIEMHVTTGGIYRGSTSHNNPRDFKNLLWPRHAPTFAQYNLLMSHLVGLGYGIVSRDDNPFASGCTELVFHRVPK